MSGAEAETGPLPGCPQWCAGRHDPEPAHVHFHESRPVVLDVLTEPVTMQFVAAMVQYPAAADPAKQRVFVWAHMSGKATLIQPSDVHAFADMLTGYAGRLREVAEELAAAQEDGRARLLEAGLKDAGREG